MRIGTTDQGLFKSRCMNIGQEWPNISNISRPLRYDEFTIKLVEGEKFIWRSSSLFKQNLTFPTNRHCLNPVLKNSNEKAINSLQNRVLGFETNLAVYSPSSIIWSSRLYGLFLWSQFCHGYLLVMIKIRNHNFLNYSVKKKSKGELLSLSKSKSRARMCCDWWRTFEWGLFGLELRCCQVRFHALLAR